MKRETTTGPTPGPWVVDTARRARGYMTAIFHSDTAVADIPCINGDPSADAEATANARLIAAAPDLLAALRETLGELEALRDSLPHPRPTAESAVTHRARAVIARAEGRSA